MGEYTFYNAGQTSATNFSTQILKDACCDFSEKPNATVTHLLLDVPYKYTDGLPELLHHLPDDITVIGGNLHAPALEKYKKIDLLQDPLYLAENANITAHCAVKLALGMLDITLNHCPILIIGWGRIGKCLARLSKQMGADVSIAARKAADRAMITALGYTGLDLSEMYTKRPQLVFNTVPVEIAHSKDFPAVCLKIELASTPGIIGDDIVDGRRLPGRLAPKSSGALIANTILRLLPGGD